MFAQQKTQKENEDKAKEYGKKIVDCLAAGDYVGILSIVDGFDNSWEADTFAEDIQELIETYKEENEIGIDPYGTSYDDAEKCEDFCYDQSEEFYYNDEDETDHDFSYEYDLLPTDLTLILDFILEHGNYKVVFYDICQL